MPIIIIFTVINFWDFSGSTSTFALDDAIDCTVPAKKVIMVAETRRTDMVKFKDKIAKMVKLERFIK